MNYMVLAARHHGGFALEAIRPARVPDWASGQRGEGGILSDRWQWIKLL